MLKGKMAALEALEKLLRPPAFDASAADEAIRLFGETRTTAEEGRAVELLLTRHLKSPLPESLLVMLASVLIDRGEGDVAEHALAHSASSPALLIRADLRAQGGDLSAAAALVERVLLRDIDFPGARERHARWGGPLARSFLSRGELRGRTDDAGMTHRFEGPFSLLREVGRGGAGTVYEAQDADLSRHVALKLYHRPDRDRAQLAHEARVAVALSGPGVVRVFDVDIERGWLAMQWAPRGALGAHLREKENAAIEPASLERWARSLAGGLARVHAAGWVHLDVKPANVLLQASGVATLTDFGTARRFGEASPPGSFGYLSPERAAGWPSDPGDDVYGFGRILEDALDPTGPGEALDGWRLLAAACTRTDGSRPRDGADLLARIHDIAPERLETSGSEGSRRDRNRG